MQAASANVLKFETLSRWASTADAELDFSDEVRGGRAPIQQPQPVRPGQPSPNSDAPPTRSASDRDQHRASLYQPRLAEDGALHPGIPTAQTFSVPAAPRDDDAGGEAAGGQQQQPPQQQPDSASDAGRRSPDPLWGGDARPASPNHRSQSQQASPPPPSWFGGDPTLHGNRLAAHMDTIRQENERLAVEEEARKPFGSLPTVSQYLATATAVHERQPAPAEYAQRERATQQTSQQERALNHSEQLELNRLRQRSHELEMNVQSSYLQAGAVHAELDQQRRATAAAEERAWRLQTKLDKERQAVQRLTSRPSPAASPAQAPAPAPARVSAAHLEQVRASSAAAATADLDRTGSSPFAAAREELSTLARATTLFSDTENDLAKSTARIAELEAIVRERDAELLRKDQQLRDKDELLRGQEELIRDKDSRLAKLASGMRQLMREAEPSIA
jgi:hypothetical protein